MFKNITPPLIIKFLKKFFYPNKSILKNEIIYVGDFKTWEEALKFSTGYDQKIILEKVLHSTLAVKNGEKVYERDSVFFENIQYSWIASCGLLLAASSSEGQLSVLDFGGSLGSCYFQNRNLINRLTKVKWNIIEQEHFVDAGNKFIKIDELMFYNNIQECLNKNKPNVILISSALQYLKNPLDVLNQLKDSGAKYLIIDRTPFSDFSNDRILIQKVPEYIYEASYPIRVFSQECIIKVLEENWHLIAIEDSKDGTVLCPDGFKFTFRGALFHAKNA